MTTTVAGEEDEGVLLAKLESRLRSFYDGWMTMSFKNGEGFDEWWKEYFAPACTGIVRSSGNPLAPSQWKAMISSDDVVYLQREKQKIVSIDSSLVFAAGKAAITTFTADMYFTYKGNMNEDRAKISLTWELTSDSDSQWRIIHFQRATGQPIPKKEEE